MYKLIIFLLLINSPISTFAQAKKLVYYHQPKVFYKSKTIDTLKLKISKSTLLYQLENIICHFPISTTEISYRPFERDLYTILQVGKRQFCVYDSYIKNSILVGSEIKVCDHFIKASQFLAQRFSYYPIFQFSSICEESLDGESKLFYKYIFNAPIEDKGNFRYFGIVVYVSVTTGKIYKCEDYQIWEKRIEN
jgi:hypothetical protein